MRRIPFVAFGVVLLLVVLVAPAIGASPFLDISQDKGSSAYADSTTCTEDVPDVGDETCSSRGASVFIGWTRYNGERSKGSQLCAFIGSSVYDASAQTYTDTSRFGCSQTGVVAIAKTLASASASGSAPTESQQCVYDVAADTFDCTDPVAAAPIAVDLTWTGILPAFKSTFRERDQFGNCFSTYYNKGSSADATVDGTFDGGAATFDSAQISAGSSHFTNGCH